MSLFTVYDYRLSQQHVGTNQICTAANMHYYYYINIINDIIVRVGNGWYGEVISATEFSVFNTALLRTRYIFKLIVL